MCLSFKHSHAITPWQRLIKFNKAPIRLSIIPGGADWYNRCLDNNGAGILKWTIIIISDLMSHHSGTTGKLITACLIIVQQTFATVVSADVYPSRV